MNDWMSRLNIMSLKDKMRLMQCVFCKRDPEQCGGSEENEDEFGMCKEYNGDVEISTENMV